MPDRETVATHYARETLIDCIESGMGELGITRDTVTVEDLGPVDEFHIGGRMATAQFLNAIALAENDHVLDIGCGLGGACRFATQQYGCRVTGIDLTEDYVFAGRELSKWVGFEQRVQLEQGDAAKTPFMNDVFDKAYMLHVGMNIADKTALFSEILRVIKPGGVFGVYDIMRIGSGELTYPMPWATASNASVLGTRDEYRNALQTAGFTVLSERSRQEFALEFYAKMQARMAEVGGPPPLGLHIVMGDDAPTKLGNMIREISQNRIAPIEMIARA